MSATALSLQAERDVGYMTTARQFFLVARSLLAAGVEKERLEGDALRLERLAPLASRVLKASAHHLGEEPWEGNDARRLAESFLASIAPQSLLDSIAQYASPIPWEQTRVLAAMGFVANPTPETALKVIRRADLSLREIQAHTVASMLVMSNQMARSTAGAAQRLFERELTSAVLRGMNEHVLSLLSIGTTLASTGDALADLKAVLAASPDSLGYVVATAPSACRELALVSDGRMGVRGGLFVDGVSIVPAIEPASDTPLMVAIPASRFVFSDAGLTLRSALHASVNMSDTPEGPSEVVSLFQTNSVGLLAERMFQLRGADDCVAVG